MSSATQAQSAAVRTSTPVLGHRQPPAESIHHEGKWSRFSWFSFDAVGEKPTKGGWHEVLYRKDSVPAQDELVMTELEALLIMVLNTRRQNKMRFQAAQQWIQAPDD